MNKQEIIACAEAVENKNRQALAGLQDRVSVLAYRGLVRTDESGTEIWTDAINEALRQHQVVVIPRQEIPYYIDDSLILHSGSRLEAGDAVIRMKAGISVLMLRNEHVVDETHLPCPKDSPRDCNLSVDGGTWEEMQSSRGGYGKSGMFDRDRSIYGVSTCMLFSNVTGLTLTNLQFIHTAGFAVQIGNARNVWCENIHFTQCFADGIHINGNTSDISICNLSGNVGDDIIALNAYDWQDSSIDWGPISRCFCRDITLAPEGRYKAIRMETGIYRFRDGSSVDCSISELVIRKVRGIKNFKLYLQTPRYPVSKPDVVGVGSGDNLYFEDIRILLDGPIDRLPNYVASDAVTGTIAGLEIGANIGTVSLENIDFQADFKTYPQACLIAAGPKSSLSQDGLYEVFDPYVKCTVQKLQLANVRINGQVPADISPYIRSIRFDRIYDSDFATGWGILQQVDYRPDGKG